MFLLLGLQVELAILLILLTCLSHAQPPANMLLSKVLHYKSPIPTPGQGDSRISVIPPDTPGDEVIKRHGSAASEYVHVPL
jgi:hypothetical protein